MIVGYAHPKAANLDAQKAALRAAGCSTLFVEGENGAAPGSELDGAINFLRMGDTLVVARLAAAARNARELAATVARVTARGADFYSLASNEQWFDTADNGIRAAAIGFAAFDADSRASTAAEGIKLAKKRGAKLGRPQ